MDEDLEAYIAELRAIGEDAARYGESVSVRLEPDAAAPVWRATVIFSNDGFVTECTGTSPREALKNMAPLLEAHRLGHGGVTFRDFAVYILQKVGCEFPAVLEEIEGGRDTGVYLLHNGSVRVQLQRARPGGALLYWTVADKTTDMERPLEERQQDEVANFILQQLRLG